MPHARTFLECLSRLPFPWPLQSSLQTQASGSAAPAHTQPASLTDASDRSFHWRSCLFFIFLIASHLFQARQHFYPWNRDRPPLGERWLLPSTLPDCNDDINNPSYLFRALRFQMLFIPALLLVHHAGRGWGSSGQVLLGCKEVWALKVTLRIWVIPGSEPSLLESWASRVVWVVWTAAAALRSLSIPGARVSDSGWSWAAQS